MPIVPSRGQVRSAWNQLLSWMNSCQGTLTFGEPFFMVAGRRKTHPHRSLSDVRNALVVRLDDVGDMVLSSPFVRELRKTLPTSHITLVVKPSVHNLVERCPYVNEVLTYDPGPLSETTTTERMWRTIRFSAHYLWRRSIDLAIVPRWDADLYHASFVAYWSGAWWRVGYSEQVIEHKRAMNRGFDQLFSEVMTDVAIKHEVERGLDLLRLMGGVVEDDSLELWQTEADQIKTHRLLQAHGLHDEDLLIAFAPGASSDTRRWPTDNFSKLGRWLLHEYRARIVLIGTHEEKPLGKNIQYTLGQGVINAMGETSLRELGVLLRRCALYVGNDTGPMHMAAAAGVPVVEISCHPINGNSGLSNSPRRFGPWDVGSEVVQPEQAAAGCREACISTTAHCICQVEVRRVREAVGRLLQKCQHRVSSSASAIASIQTNRQTFS